MSLSRFTSKGLLYLQEVGEGGMLVFLLFLNCQLRFSHNPPGADPVGGGGGG